MGEEMSKAPTWREYLMPDELAEAMYAEACVAKLRNRAVQRMRLAYAAKNSKRVRHKYSELPRPEMGVLTAGGVGDADG
jgi:hypothetical protein